MYAFIREARKQKQGASSLFEKFAGAKGWGFSKEDTGTIQTIAKSFQGIGQFYSPSRGKLLPHNVISGSIPEGSIHFFQHTVRVYDGYALQLNVFFLQLNTPINQSLVIRFKKGKKKISNLFYTDPEIPLDETLSGDIVVHGKDSDAILQFINTIDLSNIIRSANKLKWRVDLQIKNDRIALYLSERNADIETHEDLIALLEFLQAAVTSLKHK